MDQVQAPYYVEYRVKTKSEDIWSGGRFTGPCAKTRHVTLVGEWLVAASGDYNKTSYFGRGQGESSILPWKQRFPIRAASPKDCWLATDDAYKAAGQALAESRRGDEAVQRGTEFPVDGLCKAPQMIAWKAGRVVSLKNSILKPGWKKTRKM